MPWAQDATGDWIWVEGGNPQFGVGFIPEAEPPPAAGIAPGGGRPRETIDVPGPAGSPPDDSVWRMQPPEPVPAPDIRADARQFAPIYRNEMELSDPEFRAYAREVNARGDGIDIALGMEIDGETGKPLRPIPRRFRMV